MKPILGQLMMWVHFWENKKKDLCIGVDGYPKYVIIGDQQTYSIMKNSKVKYSDHYNWMYPVPGDWHLMKTAAEVIKYVLQDGFIKQFSGKCGHKGDISQWQDIHNVVVACISQGFT